MHSLSGSGKRQRKVQRIEKARKLFLHEESLKIAKACTTQKEAEQRTINCTGIDVQSKTKFYRKETLADISKRTMDCKK